jgi:outer membrane protein assembly factor BamB
MMKRITTNQPLRLLIVAAALLGVPAAQAGMTELWLQQLGNDINSTPAIDSNGVLYITCSGYTNFKDFSGGKLIALSPQGKVKWEFKTFCDIKSSAAIGDNGNVYFGGRDRIFYAISPVGKAKWQFRTEAWIDSSAAIATNGTIYFGGWDKKFYALNPDGEKKWEFATGGPIDSSPAIAADGTVYFGSHDKKFYAFNPDGSLKWVFKTEGAIISSPALNCDGTIYFTSVDGNLYVLKNDGTEKWRLKTGGVGGASPVIDAEGNIYFSINNLLQCLTATGKKKWDFGYPRMDGAAALAADGTAFYGVTGDAGVGAILGFDLNGNLPLHDSMGGAVSGSPAIANNGDVYLGSSVGFFAFKGNSGLARSCWPKFRGNAAQTGRLNVN